MRSPIIRIEAIVDITWKMFNYLKFLLLLYCLRGKFDSFACDIRPINPLTDSHDLKLNCSDPLKLISLNASHLENVSQISLKCASLWTDSTSTSTKPPQLLIRRLRRLKVEGCGIDSIRLLSNLKHDDPLIIMDLSSNHLEGFEWQLARKFRTHKLDLTDNPINCTCANKWLFDFHKDESAQYSINPNITTIANFLQLPLHIRLLEYESAKCDPKCPLEEINLEPPIINTTINAMATLRCRMRGALKSEQPNFNPENLFRWPTSSEQAIEERRNRMKIVMEKNGYWRMDIWNLTSDDLGIIICECLECVAPKYAQSEFRFNAAITTKIEKDMDATYLVVHGYPLRNITMNITRLKDMMSETRMLISRKNTRPDVKFFNNKLTVRYNSGHSFTSLKYYQFLVSQDTETTDYMMQLCTPRANDCTNITFKLGPDVLRYSNFTDPRSYSPRTSAFAYLLFVLLIFCAIGTIVLVAFQFYRRDKTASKLVTAVGWHKNRFRRISRNTNRTEETSLRMDDTLSATMSNYSLQHVPVIDRDNLVLADKIGQGAFGEVFIGNWLSKDTRVAVKVLHNVQVDAQMDKEAAMLAALDHENVVKMFGVSRGDMQSLYLVLELMNMGDLKTYVKQRQPQCDNYSQFPPALLNTELINIAQQICNGLSYIHLQQIVHRDLAARNCLVAGESDLRICAAAFRPPITVKISDFGMSRRLYSQAEYYKMGDKKTQLPVRWLPPECLECGRFTYHSDIWSFGVTLFELFTFGAMPYGDLSNNEALMAVISGVRPTLGPKSKCPSEVAEIMKDCWKTAADERPAADDVLMRLKMIQ